MTIQQILDAVGELETEITRRSPGDPDLAATTRRIAELQWELELIRRVQGPLVPDASSPPSPAEQAVAELEMALRDLKSAVAMKIDRSSPIGEMGRTPR